MPKIHIFISHSSREQIFSGGAAEFVSVLETMLAAQAPGVGFEIFVDKIGIRSAEDWRERILCEVRKSHVFIFTGSQDWFESQWCTRELKEFVRAGQKSEDDFLPTGRAILRLALGDIDFSRVSWLRRYNAHYVNRLIATRQHTQTLVHADSTADPYLVARKVSEISRDLPDFLSIQLPGIRENWKFLPVGLRIIAFTALVVAVGSVAFVLRNEVLDSREVRAKKGVFRTIVRNQGNVYHDMRSGLNNMLPAGLPSQLPSLQTSQGETFNRKWGFAVRDIERYFKPLASCLEQRSCHPVDHAALCSNAEQAIVGHTHIFRFFNNGGGNRGFLFVMGGSRPIFELDPRATIREPPFQYSPTFHKLACSDEEELGLGGALEEPSCSEDLKFALSWAYTWQSRAQNGQLEQLHDQQVSLQAIDHKLLQLGGVNGIFSHFERAILDLRKMRHERRPNIDPGDLDSALDERIFRNVRNMQNLIDPMNNCIVKALSDNPIEPDEIALGSALLLDTFLDPESATRFREINAILSDPGRRDMDDLVTLMHAFETTRSTFMESSMDNYLTCQSIMSDMFKDPGFRFRLRNRRDPENNMRILAFEQDTVTTSIGDLRRSCN